MIEGVPAEVALGQERIRPGPQASGARAASVHRVRSRQQTKLPFLVASSPAELAASVQSAEAGEETASASRAARAVRA